MQKSKLWDHQREGNLLPLSCLQDPPCHMQIGRNWSNGTSVYFSILWSKIKENFVRFTQHKKKSSQNFCQKTTNFVQQKLLMVPQKGRTSTNYEPMGRVWTFEHTSLLDPFLGFIPERISRVPAWYPPDAGMHRQQWQPSHLFRNHEERVTCRLATYLSQCTHWLHQLPLV
jgi:hypothetical protein